MLVFMLNLYYANRFACVENGKIMYMEILTNVIEILVLFLWDFSFYDWASNIKIRIKICIQIRYVHLNSAEQAALLKIFIIIMSLDIYNYQMYDVNR